MDKIGNKIYKWVEDLFPICRSLTGNGVRETLKYFQNLLPELQIHEVPSGTKVFDWTVPDEWNIYDAYIADEQGNRIVDFKEHNLHVMGYSEPVDEIMTFKELDQYLYSLPELPNAIPYVTSYYERRWGFCITENQRDKLRINPEAKYHIKIDSTLEPGNLTYGELIIPGSTDKEIFYSTYICHPSMANNELSGPTVTTAIAQYIASIKKRKYTYRIIFIPETIGSITYLSMHAKDMINKTIAGFNVNCLGDEHTYSHLPSKQENSLADRVARHVLSHHADDYIQWSFLERGSDERQYCSPGIDLPVTSIMRSKYGTYPEYHTSLDDLSFVTANGLQGSYEAHIKCIEVLEENEKFKSKVYCEPQLGKRGLYPTISRTNTYQTIEDMMNIIIYSDGNNDLLSIAELSGVYVGKLIPIAKKLLEEDLLETT